MANEKTTGEYRNLYARALTGLSYEAAKRADVHGLVLGVLSKRGICAAEATPRQWVAAIQSVRVSCRRCAGTGAFITGNLNGRPVGPGGICFRCEGRGHQTHRDGHRNRSHDQHAFGQAVRQMMGG